MTPEFKDKPQAHWLPDGRRIEMRHGPIHLILEAFGRAREIKAAYRQAVQAFDTVLFDLAGELDVLRRPVSGAMSIQSGMPRGIIAKKMYCAAERFAGDRFVTPMIAVAGAVADHILRAMIKGRSLDRAYVNNGGDIALYLSDGCSFDLGVCGNPQTGSIVSTASVHADNGVGGIATSGWHGRSHSLGIADAVTVFAKDAAHADTAATLIANAIDLPNHPAIERLAANVLSPDSDLGDLAVTVGVGSLSNDDIERALSGARPLAQMMIDRGDIFSIFAVLKSGMFSRSAMPEEQCASCVFPSATRQLLEICHA